MRSWIDWQTGFSPVFLFQGIVKRDEIVFRAARRRGVPILMVTSGGYQKKTARIIADSILNLHRQGLIGAEALEGEGSSSLVTSMMCGSGPVGSASTAVWDALILGLTPTGVFSRAVTFKGTQVTLHCAVSMWQQGWYCAVTTVAQKCVYLRCITQCLFALIQQTKELWSIFLFFYVEVGSYSKGIITQREKLYWNNSALWTTADHKLSHAIKRII